MYRRSILILLVVSILHTIGTMAETPSKKTENTERWNIRYDRFNTTFLDSTKFIYKDLKSRPHAVDRWNGAAAIWCQATYYDMAISAYERSKREHDRKHARQYKKFAQQLLDGCHRQYVDFNFDDCNINTGWFVYDDIMWWTCALARSYKVFGWKRDLEEAKRSFWRVWKGSEVVGDDGSYADPARGLGGGMFWEWQPIDRPKPHRPGDFRAACINFPTVIAACRLQEIEGKQTEKYKAIEIYEWAHRTLVRNGRVADGIHNGGPEFTDHLYNQATYIGASCMLYRQTQDSTYLHNACQAADYVFHHMTDDHGLLRVETGPEQGIYCAIFAQYLHMLVYDFHQTQYLSLIQRHIRAAQLLPSYDDSYTASGLPALMLMFP